MTKIKKATSVAQKKAILLSGQKRGRDEEPPPNAAPPAAAAAVAAEDPMEGGRPAPKRQKTKFKIKKPNAQKLVDMAQGTSHLLPQQEAAVANGTPQSEAAVANGTPRQAAVANGTPQSGAAVANGTPRQAAVAVAMGTPRQAAVTRETVRQEEAVTLGTAGLVAQAPLFEHSSSHTAAPSWSAEMRVARGEVVQSPPVERAEPLVAARSTRAMAHRASPQRRADVASSPPGRLTANNAATRAPPAQEDSDYADSWQVGGEVDGDADEVGLDLDMAALAESKPLSRFTKTLVLFGVASAAAAMGFVSAAIVQQDCDPARDPSACFKLFHHRIQDWMTASPAAIEYPPCFADSANADYYALDALPDRCHGQSQARTPCPPGAMCVGGVLLDCPKHTEVAPAGASCIMSGQANETIMSALGVVHSLTAVHRCKGRGKTHGAVAWAPNAKDWPLFSYKEVAEQVSGGGGGELDGALIRMANDTFESPLFVLETNGEGDELIALHPQQTVTVGGLCYSKLACLKVLFSFVGIFAGILAVYLGCFYDEPVLVSLVSLLLIVGAVWMRKKRAERELERRRKDIVAIQQICLQYVKDLAGREVHRDVLKHHALCEWPGDYKRGLTLFPYVKLMLERDPHMQNNKQRGLFKWIQK